MKAATPKQTRTRVSYKTLLMDERARANNLADRMKAAERELLRIRGVLAKHARKETVPEIEQILAERPSLGAIALYPLSFEAMKALMISEARYTDDGVVGVGYGSENYSWRGRPLVSVE